MSSFALDLLGQGWLDDALADVDLCSHGRVRVAIGGIVIVDGAEDYGVSEAALALLRTLDRDHTPEVPVADHLLPHGCGTILMTSCPIGASWSVVHDGPHVELSNAVVRTTTGDVGVRRYPGVLARVPAALYEAEILRLATAVEDFFSGSPKRLDDGFDRQQHDEFWREFHQRRRRRAR